MSFPNHILDLMLTDMIDGQTTHQKPTHLTRLGPRRRRQEIRVPHRRDRELETGAWITAFEEGKSGKEFAERADGAE